MSGPREKVCDLGENKICDQRKKAQVCPVTVSTSAARYFKVWNSAYSIIAPLLRHETTKKLEKHVFLGFLCSCLPSDATLLTSTYTQIDRTTGEKARRTDSHIIFCSHSMNAATRRYHYHQLQKYLEVNSGAHAVRLTLQKLRGYSDRSNPPGGVNCINLKFMFHSVSFQSFFFSVTRVTVSIHCSTFP